MNTIIDDPREIAGLDFGPNDILVDRDCTKIVPYEENGEMANVVWFAVYVDDLIVKRVNSKFVLSVNYKLRH
jgi:hypothetical protein